MGHSSPQTTQGGHAIEEDPDNYDIPNVVIGMEDDKQFSNYGQEDSLLDSRQKRMKQKMQK